MQLTQDLAQKIREDPEGMFFDVLGNMLFAAETYADSYHKHPRLEIRTDINRAQRKFYERLEFFLSTGFEPKGNITPEALQKFNDYRTTDWTVKDKLEQVKEYLCSLKREE